MNKLPDTAALEKHLSTLIYKREISPGPVEIISRNAFIDTSTFPVEIITCKLTDGRVVNFFCKYSGGQGPNNFGHRGGVEYECRVYSEVLGNIPLTVPVFYGNCFFLNNNETVLILEYLQDSVRLFETDEPEKLLKEAAVWIAHFHNLYEQRSPAFLINYDKDYYCLWVNRVKGKAKEADEKYAWVANMCNYFLENVHILEGMNTVIHGEYYPKNILINNNKVYPIDWESTAVGAGEIDLASLIDGWKAVAAEQAKEAYISIRWPAGTFSKELFEKRLLLAAIYFHFRWIADERDFDLGQWLKNRKVYKELLSLAKRAGCV